MSTIEVVPVPGGSARVGVYSRDHCPPHATCRDIAGGWVVRISFSFLNRRVGLMSIHGPGARAVNDLALAVQRNLPECRRLWWTYQQNNPVALAEGPCCLNNQPHAGGTIVAADYDPATCTTRVRFADGSIVSQIV
jgi:hypothetical protein